MWKVQSSFDLERLSDLELVALANDGDESAFEVLYHRHKEWVANLAFRWTGDRDLALDVLQETFLYFSKKFPGFRLTARLQTFLYPAVRNLAITARRKLGHQQPTTTDEEAVEDSPVSQPAHGAGNDLNAVLATLPEVHREVVLLRFVDELDLKEIAVALDIPVGTVKSRLHNALASLRNDPRTKKHFAQ